MLLQSTAILVQTEVHTRCKPEFELKYKEMTGQKPSGQSYLENKKPGVVCQISFSASEIVAKNLQVFGYKVAEFHNGEFRFCVESEPLFWKLVRNGFRIGENQNEARRRLEAEAAALLGCKP